MDSFALSGATSTCILWYSPSSGFFHSMLRTVKVEYWAKRNSFSPYSHPSPTVPSVLSMKLTFLQRLTGSK